jgi:hypothetical protein
VVVAACVIIALATAAPAAQVGADATTTSSTTATSTPASTDSTTTTTTTGTTTASTDTTMPTPPSTTTTSTPSGPVTFTAGGSVNQVYTYGHATGIDVELLDDTGTVVQTGTTDAQGAYLFQEVTKGTGYVVREGGDGGPESGPLTVTDPGDNPPQSFYDGITLHEGFGYLPTRDGTLLSVNITFPKDGSKPPWPVVMDYSGYDPSQPGDPPQEAAFYPYDGYVTVGVNMRGTTCSGGRFSFFEPLQSTDGYDAVEALAAQSWSNGNVGLVGISYSGYSQLYVAATDPPHLRAITPLSPFGDTYRGILYPGGILNDGFALSWATDRQDAARPANDQWVKDRIAGGDTTCAANQVMRLQSENMLAEIQPGRFDERPLGDYLDTTTFVDKIDVPVYLASQFQDEQTGGSAMEDATILDTHPDFKAVFTNGTHVEGLGPTELPRVLEFIDFYVGMKIPKLGAELRVGVPPALESIFGGPITLPYDRFSSYTSYAAALAAYQAEPPIRIRWENGGKAGLEGSPYSVDDTGYSAWPIPGTTAQRWYLQPDSQLSTSPPTVADDQARGSSSYIYDPTTRRAETCDGCGQGDMWIQHPNVQWDPLSEGNSLSFTTPAYAKATAYAGTGSVDLWIKSSAADTDFEAELTQVYPNGTEQLIQSGWLRASRRKLDDARSTTLLPYETQLAGDAEPIPPDQYVLVRIPLFPFAEIISAGAKLRLNIQAPGGNQPFWSYDDLPGTSTNTIGHSVGFPSSVALPLIPVNNALLATTAKYGTPNPCVVAGVTDQSPSDRGQPCRPYHPARQATNVTATGSPTGVNVSWTAPAAWADGTDGPVTGYLVTENPTGRTVTVPGDVTTASFTTESPDQSVDYTVQAQYGADTAPASDASLSTFTSPAERFVHAAYLSLLGRPVDTGGLAFWLAKLAGGTTRSQMALSLTASSEYRRAEVAATYQAILGRQPTTAEATAGLAYLGPPNANPLRAELLGSDEFWNLSGKTQTGFAQHLYQAGLGRAPDAASIAYVKSQLGAGRTRQQVAAWLLSTHEAETHRIALWYQQYLGRTPSATESAFWAGQLDAGHTEPAVIAQLVGSNEYLTRA